MSCGGAPSRTPRSEHVPYRAGARVSLRTERSTPAVVMTPWEQEGLVLLLLNDLGAEGDGSVEAKGLRERLQTLTREWRATWAQHGPAQHGWLAYRELLAELERGIAPLEHKLRLSNGADAVEAVRQMLIQPALNLGLASAGAARGRRLPAPPRQFERPIFIVAPPRSGTALLFETLALSPSVWTIGGESHQIIERLARPPSAQPGLGQQPADRRPTPAPGRHRLRGAFLAELRDRDGNPPPGTATGLRLLEKTPKNSLRVPFFNAVFPDAPLHLPPPRAAREPEQHDRRLGVGAIQVTYPDLPDWDGPPWSLVLTPSGAS